MSHKESPIGLLPQAIRLSRASLLSVLAGLAVTITSCDSVTGGDQHSVAQDVKRIMYWGRVAPDQDEANQGYEVGNIDQPVWYQPDRIAIRTGRTVSGDFVRGIFDIEIDPTTLAFQTFHTFGFPYLIRDFDYDPASGYFAVTFSRDPTNIQTVRAHGQEPTLAVVDTVLNEQWFPRAARFTNSDLVVYARSPATQVAGFYYVPAGGAQKDSLVIARDLSIPDARGFDIGGGQLCFGVTTDFKTQVFVKDLGQQSQPRRVATVAGEFVSVSVNQSGTCAIVSTFVYGSNEAGNVVGVLNLGTGAYKRLDVRTRPDGYVIADFAHWNPASNMFAFSASAFTGESQVFPRQLWARKAVQCP